MKDRKKYIIVSEKPVDMVSDELVIDYALNKKEHEKVVEIYEETKFERRLVWNQ
jgi:hypothetical protein